MAINNRKNDLNRLLENIKNTLASAAARGGNGKDDAISLLPKVAIAQSSINTIQNLPGKDISPSFRSSLHESGPKNTF